MARKQPTGHDLMGLSRDELLRPSLADTTIAKAPYSVQTAFLASFFGGPLAAVAIIAINSVRLRRLLRDLAPLAIAVMAYVAFMLALTGTEWGMAFRASLNGLIGERSVSYLNRLVALVLFGLGYALHRKEQRSADLMGLDRPNGWIAGFVCIAGGIVLLLALDAAVGR
jgi:hypothetical protein